jgi:hypothetical protein
MWKTRVGICAVSAAACLAAAPGVAHAAPRVGGGGGAHAAFHAGGGGHPMFHSSGPAHVTPHVTSRRVGTTHHPTTTLGTHTLTTNKTLRIENNKLSI